jgi:hypothetical protein
MGQGSIGYGRWIVLVVVMGGKQLGGIMVRAEKVVSDPN